jgi:hypothetical protein
MSAPTARLVLKRKLGFQSGPTDTIRLCGGEGKRCAAAGNTPSPDPRRRSEKSGRAFQMANGKVQMANGRKVFLDKNRRAFQVSESSCLNTAFYEEEIPPI